MRRTRSIPVAAVLLTLVTVAMVPAAWSRGGGDLACGEVITSDVVLMKNLTCAGDALTVTNGAHLDLHGHAVRGDGTGTGVTILNNTSAPGPVVTNGTITGFNVGVGLNANNARLEDLAIKKNSSSGILFAGLAFSAPTGGDIVQRNRIDSNGEGIRFRSEQGAGSQILDNAISDNNGDGIVAVFASDHVVYQGNKVSHNAGNGINIADSTSTILDNRLGHNGLDGLRAEESLPAAVPNWLIGDNHATHNGGHGLNVLTPGIPDGGGNRASHNALDPQCVNIAC